MNGKYFFFLGISFTVASLALIYYLYPKFFNKNSFENKQSSIKTTTASSTPAALNTGIVATPINSPSINSESETSDSILYEDKDRGFSLTHPAILAPEVLGDGAVAFTLFGPTQAQDTEFFDGINLSFMQNLTGGEDFYSLVKQSRQNLADIYGEDVVSQIDPIEIAGRSGFIFNDHMAQYIYVSQGKEKYLEILNMTADPENLGYKQTAFEMIESLKILE